MDDYSLNFTYVTTYAKVQNLLNFIHARIMKKKLGLKKVSKMHAQVLNALKSSYYSVFFIPFCLFFLFSFFDCIVQKCTVVVLNPSFPYLLSSQAGNDQVLLINNPLSITLYTEEIEKSNALFKSASDWVRFRGQPDYGSLSNNLRRKNAQYTLYIYQIRPLINTQAFNDYL